MVDLDETLPIGDTTHLPSSPLHMHAHTHTHAQSHVCMHAHKSTGNRTRGVRARTPTHPHTNTHTHTHTCRRTGNKSTCGSGADNHRQFGTAWVFLGGRAFPCEGDRSPRKYMTFLSHCPAGDAVPDCMGVAWLEWRGKTIGRMRRWHLSPEIARTLVAVRHTHRSASCSTLIATQYRRNVARGSPHDTAPNATRLQ